MKEIALTQGLVALVDDEDYERLNQFTWYAHKGKNTFYARTSQKPMVYMHKMLLDAPIVDHINGNGVDNTKNNLRAASQTNNNANGRKRRNATSSKFKGVSFDSTRQKWECKVNFQGRRVFFGRYDSELDAAKAYNEAALSIFGSFAKVNEL